MKQNRWLPLFIFLVLSIGLVGVAKPSYTLRATEQELKNNPAPNFRSPQIPQGLEASPSLVATVPLPFVNTSVLTNNNTALSEYDWMVYNWKYQYYIKQNLDWGEPTRYYVGDNGFSFYIEAPEEWLWRNEIGEDEYLGALQASTGSINATDNSKVHYQDIFTDGAGALVNYTLDAEQEGVYGYYVVNQLPTNPSLSGTVYLAFGFDFNFNATENAIMFSNSTGIYLWDTTADPDVLADEVRFNHWIQAGDWLDFDFRLPPVSVVDADENTITGRYWLRSQGVNLWVYKLIPYSWLASAVYPVTIDPTVIAINSGAVGERSAGGGQKFYAVWGEDSNTWNQTESDHVALSWGDYDTKDVGNVLRETSMFAEYDSAWSVVVNTEANVESDSYLNAWYSTDNGSSYSSEIVVDTDVGDDCKVVRAIGGTYDGRTMIATTEGTTLANRDDLWIYYNDNSDLSGAWTEDHTLISGTGSVKIYDIIYTNNSDFLVYLSHVDGANYPQVEIWRSQDGGDNWSIEDTEDTGNTLTLYDASFAYYTDANQGNVICAIFKKLDQRKYAWSTDGGDTWGSYADIGSLGSMTAGCGDISATANSTHFFVFFIDGLGTGGESQNVTYRWATAEGDWSNKGVLWNNTVGDSLDIYKVNTPVQACSVDDALYCFWELSNSTILSQLLELGGAPPEPDPYGDSQSSTNSNESENAVDNDSSNVDSVNDNGTLYDFSSMQDCQNSIYGNFTESSYSESGATTSEWLNVDYWDTVYDAWDNYIGSTPFLEAQDYPSNYIHERQSELVDVGWFYFDTPSGSGTLTVNVSIWGFSDDADDGVIVYVDETGSGSGSNMGTLILDQNTGSYKTLALGDYTVSEVTNMRIFLRTTDTTIDDVEVDHMRLGVSWTPTIQYRLLDHEVQWTTADYDESNEYVCVYAGTFNTSENLQLYIWDGASWDLLDNDLTASSWNNYSVSTYLTSATLTLKFNDTTTQESERSAWLIDCITLHVYSKAWTLNTWNVMGLYSWHNATKIEAEAEMVFVYDLLALLSGFTTVVTAIRNLYDALDLFSSITLTADFIRTFFDLLALASTAITQKTAVKILYDLLGLGSSIEVTVTAIRNLSDILNLESGISVIAGFSRTFYDTLDLLSSVELQATAQKILYDVLGLGSAVAITVSASRIGYDVLGLNSGIEIVTDYSRNFYDTLDLLSDYSAEALVQKIVYDVLGLGSAVALVVTGIRNLYDTLDLASGITLTADFTRNFYDALPITSDYTIEFGIMKTVYDLLGLGSAVTVTATCSRVLYDALDLSSGVGLTAGFARTFYDVLDLLSHYTAETLGQSYQQYLYDILGLGPGFSYVADFSRTFYDALELLSDYTVTKTGLFTINLYDLLAFLENNPFSPYIEAPPEEPRGGGFWYVFVSNLPVIFGFTVVLALICIGYWWAEESPKRKKRKKDAEKAKRKKRKARKRKIPKKKKRWFIVPQ